MKVFNSLAVVFALTCLSAKAQSFQPASIPDIPFPDASIGIVKEVDHVSCYGFYGSDPSGNYGNFNVHSWSPPNEKMLAGIAYVFTDNTNSSTWDKGIEPVKRALDLEVGTIDVSGTKIVIASYYNSKGVFINVYKYVFGGGLFLSETRNLSEKGRKPRIDSHKGYGVTVTWEEDFGVMIKAIGIENGGLKYGENLFIHEAKGGRIPDVAFGHDYADLDIRVAFFNPNTYTIDVIKQEFFTVLGAPPSSIPFIMEDQLNVREVTYIDIDCPDHSSDTRWAYAFTMNNALYARSYAAAVSSSPVTFPVSGPYLRGTTNRKPSVAYSNNIDEVNIAWSFDKEIIAVQRDVAGGFITPPGTFLIVPKYPQYNPYFSYVALSKSNENSSDLYHAFSMQDPNIGMEMRYKFKPYGSSTYRGQGETATADVLNPASLNVYPNPFTEYFQLDAHDQAEVLSVQVIDFTGRIVFADKGSVTELNSRLETAGPEFNAGIYIVKVDGKEQGSFKIVKQ